MNFRILKWAVLGTFFVFAGAVFFTPGDKTDARDRRSAVLEKVRSYKTWKQVVKPPEKAPEINLATVLAKDSTFQIDQSSVAG